MVKSKTQNDCHSQPELRALSHSPSLACLFLSLSIFYPFSFSFRAHTHTHGLCVLWLNDRACQDGRRAMITFPIRCTTDLIQQRDQFHCVFTAVVPSLQSAFPFCRTFVFYIYCCFCDLASVQLAVSACGGSYIRIELMETRGQDL